VENSVCIRKMRARRECLADLIPTLYPKNGVLRRLAANIVLQMSSLYHSLQTWFGFLASFGQRHFAVRLRWRHSNTQTAPCFLLLCRPLIWCRYSHLKTIIRGSFVL
jgi:hypothetical protein